MMDKNVRTVLLLDEAVPLLVVEPLHDTVCHAVFPPFDLDRTVSHCRLPLPANDCVPQVETTFPSSNSAAGLRYHMLWLVKVKRFLGRWLPVESAAPGGSFRSPA